MEALDWARAHGATGEPVLEKDRPWARTTRIGALWLKECRPVQAYEPRLTAALHERWPDRVTEVVAHDEARAWLLTRDAGAAEPAFTDALPLYAELQQGEAAFAEEHLAHGVPDLRVEALPALYEEVRARFDLPLAGGEFERLCAELPPLPPTVQHDDLHEGNVTGVRVLDWGDTSISHPFFSLVVAHWNGEPLDAYLEPWGDAAAGLDAALRVGALAHFLKWVRIRDALSPDERAELDRWFPRTREKTVESL
jgi:hypothetical protein